MGVFKQLLLEKAFEADMPVPADQTSIEVLVATSRAETLQKELAHLLDTIDYHIALNNEHSLQALKAAATNAQTRMQAYIVATSSNAG